MGRYYEKHFIALESDPDFFTKLAHDLGAPPGLVFKELVSMDESELLPHPAYALIFIFPTTDRYEKQRSEEDASICKSVVEMDNIVWFEQKINNACGLYAILHSLSNGPSRSLLEPQSLLKGILEGHATRDQLGKAIVGSEHIESMYKDIAQQGTRVPDNAEDEVDHHYICFVKSSKNGHVYELDGDRKGPIDRGTILGPHDDILGGGVLELIQDHIACEKGEIGFNLMALVNET